MKFVGLGVLISFIILVMLLNSFQPVITIGSQTFPDNNIAGENSVWDKWFRAYEMVVELSSVGMNVSKHLPGLQKAYEYLEKGDYASAENILDNLLPSLTKLYEEKDSFVFWNNFRKIALATVIGSFPVLFYYFFPRIYLWIWYKVREEWVVEE